MRLNEPTRKFNRILAAGVPCLLPITASAQSARSQDNSNNGESGDVEPDGCAGGTAMHRRIESASRRKTPNARSYSYLLPEFFGISTIMRTISGDSGPGSISCRCRGLVLRLAQAGTVASTRRNVVSRKAHQEFPSSQAI